MEQFTPDAMEKLAEMLRPPELEVLQGEDFNSTGYNITSTRGNVPSSNTKNIPKSIEEFEELQEKEAENLSFIGGGIGDRKTPEYSMNYQQSVSAEDVFLQIGPKTPSSASCENLMVRIKMPGDKRENVDLAVDTTTVTVNSSKHYLRLSLPHGINPDTSKATWDADLETLVLTLRLDREFDFVNF